MKQEPIYKIGVIGTGFVARGLMLALEPYSNLTVTSVLTRRDHSTDELPVSPEIVTDDVDRLISSCDLVVESTGDVIYGTEVAEKVLAAGLPMVTMNAELQLVSGTMLARQGTFVEAEGDQPGSLAALDADVKAMGFTPLVYGNVKGFLNLNPTKSEMEYWAKRQGIRLNQVTSFTDGTKVQIEQALVANGLGATIACRNLSGFACTALEDGANRLAQIAEGIGAPISDYILSPTSPAGVFIVGTHSGKQKHYLEYMKLGSGPYYIITRPFHLCHLEIPKTILNVLSGNSSYTFNNGQQPTVQVYAIPKRTIKKGEFIERGLGSFDMRGEAAKIKDYPNGVPIGLMQRATFVRSVEPGKVITFADVELPNSRALSIWRQTVDEALGQTVPTAPAAGSIVGRRQGSATSVTVGIPAYNDEQNIEQVLASVVRQRERGFVLERIVVLCDGCSDKTEERARAFARDHAQIEVIGDNERIGKAARLNQLMEHNTSDILVHFDADVVLADETVLEKIVEKFEDPEVALATANYRPVEAQRLVARAILASDELWYQIRRTWRGGHNVYNVSGRATALRRDFADSFRYPRGIFADDHYVYLQALARGRKYRFVEKAVVWYTAPDSLREYLVQSGRHLREKEHVLPYFSESMRREYDVPAVYKWRGLVRSLAASPVATMLGVGLQLWLRLRPAPPSALHQTGLWEVAASTKKVNIRV